MKRLHITILFILLVFPACLHAVTDSPRLLHFTIDNGLPSNHVYSVLQDHNGYIWFATDKGVVKYNGYSFKIFNTSNGLPENDVWNIREDAAGRLLLYTTTNRLGYIRNDRYTEFKLPAVSKLYIPQLYIDHADIYLPANVDSNNVIIHIDKRDSVHYVVSRTNQHYTCIAGGNIWYFTDTSRLTERSLSTLYKITYTCRFPINTINFFLENRSWDYKDGVLYMHSPDNKRLFIVDLPHCSLRMRYLPPLFSRGETIYTSFFIQDSLFVFTNKGVVTVNDDFDNAHKDELASRLPTNAQFTYRYRDKQDRLWYATATDGVWCIAGQKSLLHRLALLPDAATGTLVGATQGGQVLAWSSSHKKLYNIARSTYMHIVDLPQQDNVFSISGANDTDMMAICSSGIFHYNAVTHSMKNIMDDFPCVINYDSETVHHTRPVGTILNRDKYKILAQSAFDAIRVAKNNIYLVSAHGLFYFKINGDTLLSYKLGRWTSKYKKMLFDSANSLILAYNKDEITTCHITDNSLLHFQLNFLAHPGINAVQSVCCDRYSNIYVLTNDKVVVINLARWRMKILATNLNMNNGAISVSGNTLVFSGNFGLGVQEIFGPLNFGRLLVLPNTGKDRFKLAGNMLVTRQGNIYLSTEAGIFTSDIDGIRNSADAIMPGGDSLFLLNVGGRSISSKRHDTLRLDQSISHFVVDAINYYGAGAPRYNFYIQSIDREWKQSNTGELFFPDLIPDRYYKVMVKVTDDLWQSSPITFYIYHPPYWYQTTNWKIVFWIFGFIALGLVVLVSALITRHYVARANERKRVLTELELRAVYSQINPHFIFNTLSSVQYFINKKNFDDAYLHVNKFSRLLRAYLKSSQDRYITLAEEVRMLANYIELQKTRFETKFDYEIVVDNKLPADSIMIPSLLLQPLVENAINHGLFHKQGHGWLSVRFAQGADSSEVICTIEDNGVGRLKAKQINDANTTKRESYGTKLTQQLINIFNEFEHMDIHLDYTDKQAPDTGTIVTLTIRNVKYVA